MVLADATRVAPPGPGLPPASSLRRGRGGIDAGGRTALRLVLFTAGLLVALGSLHVLLEGVVWWFTSAAAVVVPVLAVGVARALGRRAWQPVAAGAVASILLLTAGYARDDALFGLVPTVDTVGRWVELVNAGVASISTQRIPADATEGILFLLALAAVVSVVTIAPALDRVPAVAALPLLVVLDIPVAVRAGLAEPGWFVVVGILYLALLRVGRRRIPVPGVLVTGSLVLVGSLALPTLFPAERELTTGGSGFGTALNPLIALGDDLRRGDVVTAVTYVTDAPGSLYLRLATLDEFSGVTWEPDLATDPDSDLARFPSPPGLAPEVPRTGYTATIEVGEVSGRWLPMPYPAVSVTGLEGDWRWEPDGLAVRSSGTDAGGQQYEAAFLDVQPDRAQLTTAAEPDVDERYLALPDQFPESIRETAEAVAGTGTAYDKAIALQEFFANGDFEYSLDAPVEEGYDGTGVGVIERFLEERSGYCVHFASSMAVMARAVGVPARVVTGFLPGRAAVRDGVRVFEATSADLHAWPELYVEGVGWLRFEPTPTRGSLPDYSAIEAVDDPATPENEGADPSTAPTTAPTTAPVVPDDEAPVDAGGAATDAANPVPAVAAVVLGVIALLLAPAGARAVVRARRMRRVRDARDAEAAWAEIRDTAVDHDWSAPDSETARQLGGRLAVVVGPEVVTRVREGVEAAAYARPDAPAMTVEEVQDVRAAIASAATLAVRLRAFFLPPSLLGRVGLGRARELGEQPAAQ